MAWQQTGLPMDGEESPDDASPTEVNLAELGWRELHREAAGCRRCGLCEHRRTVVFGEGDPTADLVLIGEGPGATEDRLGRPFVGRAGELLDRILAAIDREREDVYITNVVMCRPPNNRTPRRDEIEACRPFLEEKIRHIAPEVIVLLGSTATRALIDPSARITRMRGTWQRVLGVDAMPTFHPAALLRDPSKKRETWEDFKKVAQRLDGA